MVKDKQSAPPRSLGLQLGKSFGDDATTNYFVLVLAWHKLCG
jgi:hypothetical protein